jgi:hypothetical protein
MKYKYDQVKKWAENLGFTIIKHKSGGYSWSRNSTKHKSNSLKSLVTQIQTELCPVSNQRKIDDFINTWKSFMVFEPEEE